MMKFIKKHPILMLLLSFLITFLLLGSFFFYWAFYDLNRISKDELLIESISPNASYTVKIYSSNGGATVSNGVVGELIFNKKEGKSKTIYWELGEDALVTWINDNTVDINGERLNLPHEKYDYRHK